MAELASFILHINDDGTVTVSGFTGGDGASAAQAVAAVQQAMPGSTVVPSDPWAPPADQAPWPGGAQAQASPMASYYGQAPTQPPAASPAPACVHGPLKIVPGGFSQKTQKAYTAFWSCPAPQGQQCKLNRNALPPVPAG